MAVIKISKSDIIKTNAENHKIEVKRNELSYERARGCTRREIPQIRCGNSRWYSKTFSVRS